VSAVQANKSLAECTNSSIFSAALLGESLKLSPSPQLGQYFLVPYKNKNGVTEAQFQLGSKGYRQLAIRSGQYRKIVASAVKKGELKSFNPITEEYVFEPILDMELRESLPVVGYYAAFELINGFKKEIYWSKEKMLAHADRYSSAFSLNAKGGKYPKVSYQDYLDGKYPAKDEWLYSSFWYKDFDGMAEKTMLRQLISKWGVMSIDLQRAFTSDMGVLNESGEVKYVDNLPEDPAETAETEIAEKANAEELVIEADAEETFA
jgi:recombination protein RecT